MAADRPEDHAPPASSDGSGRSGTGGSGSGGSGGGGGNGAPGGSDDRGDGDGGSRAGTVVLETERSLGSVVVQDALPDTMFVFPLRKAVPFPQLMMPLLLDTPAAREIVAKAEAHNGYLFLVLQKDPEQDV